MAGPPGATYWRFSSVFAGFHARSTLARRCSLPRPAPCRRPVRRCASPCRSLRLEARGDHLIERLVEAAIEGLALLARDINPQLRHGSEGERPNASGLFILRRTCPELSVRRRTSSIVNSTYLTMS